MTDETLQRSSRSSPRLKARIAGVLWLMVIITGLAAFAIRSPLIVRGDAATTATNILANASLFRLAFVSDLVAGICYVGVPVLLYRLLRPVNRSVSLLAAFFGLAGVIVGAVSSLNDLAALGILESQNSTVFAISQAQALAQVSLRVSGLGFTIAMVFFGLQVIMVGILIVRSAFLPRILGVLLAIGGSSYLISSFATRLAPAFGARITPFIVPMALIGEGSLTVWLIVKGVNEQRWNQQANAAAR